jgi:hypothetical protein
VRRKFGLNKRLRDVRFGSEADIALQKGMSAFTPKADMCGALPYVRFGPQADMGPRLFDHFICGVKQTIWNGEAQRFGGLEIDH